MGVIGGPSGRPVPTEGLSLMFINIQIKGASLNKDYSSTVYDGPPSLTREGSVGPLPPPGKALVLCIGALLARVRVRASSAL